MYSRNTGINKIIHRPTQVDIPWPNRPTFAIMQRKYFPSPYFASQEKEFKFNRNWKPNTVSFVRKRTFGGSETNCAGFVKSKLNPDVFNWRFCMHNAGMEYVIFKKKVVDIAAIYALLFQHHYFILTEFTLALLVTMLLRNFCKLLVHMMFIASLLINNKGKNLVFPFPHIARG